MKQFNLQEYLENPSRKVVTRDGRKVEILKTNARGNRPIIGIYEFSDSEDMETSWYPDGTQSPSSSGRFDLFFADEEEELTEFDYAVLSIISDHRTHTDSITDFAKRSSKKLLDLARKVLQKQYINCGSTLEEVYAYDKGKADVLEDLPKWKKYEGKLIGNALTCEETIMPILIWNGYYITIEDIEKLPKEE